MHDSATTYGAKPRVKGFFYNIRHRHNLRFGARCDRTVEASEASLHVLSMTTGMYKNVIINFIYGITVLTPLE